MILKCFTQNIKKSLNIKHKCKNRKKTVKQKKQNSTEYVAKKMIKKPTLKPSKIINSLIFSVIYL